MKMHGPKNKITDTYYTLVLGLIYDGISTTEVILPIGKDHELSII